MPGLASPANVERDWLNIDQFVNYCLFAIVGAQTLLQALVGKGQIVFIRSELTALLKREDASAAVEDERILSEEIQLLKNIVSDGYSR